jgi:Uma2 family endonuclease
MSDRLSVEEYLSGIEDLRRRELVWGVVREPPAPRFGHQSVVTRTTVILEPHVRSFELGQVCVSPIDVILDKERGLVVQPDVIFVSNERRSIIRGQVWGAPDLVIEVASRRTAVHDRTVKLRWYRRYGVRECWLVDPRARSIIVVNLEVTGRRSVGRFRGEQLVKSNVLPRLDVEASAFFAT